MSLPALAGLLGALVFGILHPTKNGSGQVQDPTVLGASRTFLDDFFVCNAKSVDSDFTAITNMSTRRLLDTKEFFNSNIRSSLEKALAESRG